MVRRLCESKRILYLHNLLNRPEEQMILKVLTMQEKKPTKGDWYSTVLTDMEEFKLNLTIDELKKLKKRKLKIKIKDAIKKIAFKYLCLEKDTKSKSKLKNLSYNEIKI